MLARQSPCNDRKTSIASCLAHLGLLKPCKIQARVYHARHNSAQSPGPLNRRHSPLPISPAIDITFTMVLTDAEDDNGIGGLGHLSISRDEEYYFSGSADLLVFQVETRLFRVHVAFLERLESAVFHDMLSLGPSRSDETGETAEGGSDSAPVVIPQVTISEFRTLLDFIYKPMAMHPFSQEQWIALLSLKKRFQIPIDPEFAIREFSAAKPPPSDTKIVEIADNFDIPMNLIKPVLSRLVMRDYKSFSATEIERMLSDTIMKCFKAREFFRDRYKDRRDEAPSVAAQAIEHIFFPKFEPLTWMDMM